MADAKVTRGCCEACEKAPAEVCYCGVNYCQPCYRAEVFSPSDYDEDGLREVAAWEVFRAW